MKTNVTYESCEYYAVKGNDVLMEFFDKYYNKLNKTYNEPSDNHSVYDLLVDIDYNGKTYHYYVETKFKFNKHFFDDYTLITRKKVKEINEFMKDKDKETNKFLYFNYYPMNGHAVMFNMTEPHDYVVTYQKNWSATANLTDIKPYMDKVAYCQLPMKNNENFKMFELNSTIKIKYNNKIYQYGEEQY